MNFFSTQCITGTLEYIQKRCSEALENLHTDPETGANSLRSLLLSTLQHIEDIHNEVCVLVSSHSFIFIVLTVVFLSRAF